MLRNYTLEDGSEFKTITIPKGTVLFHGLTLDKDKYGIINFKELFYNNYGFPIENGYAIEPTRNVFFYPVPYVASTVDFFNVHVMYLTNYDLELLLMIRPSEMSREATRDPSIKIKLVKVCEDISKNDLCGFEMSDYDPCFTNYCMKNYKNIDGYIAIADTDQKRFKSLYNNYFKTNNFYKLLHIMSSISKDQKGRLGIPEIVIHPFHKRKNECFYIPRRGYTIEKIIKYSIDNIAEYNYFPLLFYTTQDIYHIKDFNLEVFSKLINDNTMFDEEQCYKIIFNAIEQSLEKFLSKNGMIIKKIKYYMTIDIRTGFYILKKGNVPIESIIGDNIHIVDLDEEEDSKNDPDVDTYIVPIMYPLEKKHIIMASIGRNNNPFMNYNWRLSRNGMSLKNAYVLNKGNKDIYDKAFLIENVLERLDIMPNKIKNASITGTIRHTRKKFANNRTKINKSRKHYTRKIKINK